MATGQLPSLWGPYSTTTPRDPFPTRISNLVKTNSCCQVSMRVRCSFPKLKWKSSGKLSENTRIYCFPTPRIHRSPVLVQDKQVISTILKTSKKNMSSKDFVLMFSFHEYSDSPTYNVCGVGDLELHPMFDVMWNVCDVFNITAQYNVSASYVLCLLMHYIWCVI